MNRISKSRRPTASRVGLGAAMFLLAALVVPASSWAQGSFAETESWEFTLAPYLLFPHMNGRLAIGDTEADVDVGPGDIFERLDFGAMLYLELANQDWSVALDVIYMNLGERGMTPITGRDIEVDLKQTAVQAQALRRVAAWAEVGLGGRLSSIDGTLTIEPGEILPGTERIKTETWLDLLIAARFVIPDAGKWDVGVRGDIGGFGIGSDFAWQVFPFAGYRFSRLFELLLGYRAIGMDYESGEGETLFVYDMSIFGPQIGFLFRF